MPARLRLALGWLLPPLYLTLDVFRALRSRWRVSRMRQRTRVIGMIGERYPRFQTRPRVLAVMTHVAAAAGLGDADKAARLDGFSEALDSLCASFSHCDVDIVLNTYAGRSLIPLLPKYQQERCRVLEHRTGDPMLIGFASQDVFLERQEDFDWFLFLEDDLVLTDACFLQKLEEFNHRSPYPDALLVPHRYERNGGEKYYIDRDFHHKSWRGANQSEAEDVIHPLTSFSYRTRLLGREISFAEFTNPHAGCYCLSREQLLRWKKSGRTWYRRIHWIGPLESAATGCLFEGFRLYKPHPDNKWFLELRHWGTKYSDNIRTSATSRPEGIRCSG